MREPSCVERLRRNPLPSYWLLARFNLLSFPIVEGADGRNGKSNQKKRRGGDRRKRDIANCPQGLPSSLVLHRSAATACNIKDVRTDLRKVSAEPKSGRKSATSLRLGRRLSFRYNFLQ